MCFSFEANNILSLGGDMEQKNKYRAIKAALLISCVGFAPMAMAGASAQMLANNCVGCHGPDGNSIGPASPSIAGGVKSNFIDIMKSYKTEGGRFSTIMGRISKGFDDKEIELLADYFAAKKPMAAMQKVDKKMAAKGAKIHKKSCKKCHSDPKEEDIILNGQLKPYLLNAMHDFSSLDTGKIKSKDVKKMVKKLKKLSAADRQALADFYASQK
jgi:cytochrome subunit of sulfide dehydrogenase